MPNVLTINGGSSSIRFAVFEAGVIPRRLLAGKIDRIGLSGTHLIVDGLDGKPPHRHRLGGSSTVGFLLNWLEAQSVFGSVEAVGHRVVHGMKRSEPERVTPKLLTELRRIIPHAPEHLPREIGLIEAIGRRHPRLPQVACFDTQFHRTMPRVAKLLAVPRRYAARGVERYGFHGLSYAYLMEELGRIDRTGSKGRVILAHLGNGSSMTAVRHGKSLDTSMGFTPSGGLVMGTRTGDLDPGLMDYLLRSEGMTASQFQQMTSHDSGLLGVSGLSSDLRDLLAREANDARAADAVALYCYTAKKWLGAYAATLGGLDTLVFAGGIGEHAPIIRKRICHALGFLGIELNPRRNARNAALISTASSRVKVRVIPTDEELMIAKSVTRLFRFGR